MFAGLNRLQIQMIEGSMNDFNKDLNNQIKQRKVEVRRNKRQNLLTASHFIKFGQSQFVQTIIKSYENRSANKRFEEYIKTRESSSVLTIFRT